MNKVKELKIDNTSWCKPTKIINLIDFNPEKLNLDKTNQVRYRNGGFYLTINNIKGYFKVDNDAGGILNMMLTDDQKNKYHQIWKEVFKLVNNNNNNNNNKHLKLVLHEKIRLFDIDLPIEKIFKICSITTVIKSLIVNKNKYYLELALNHCLYEI